MAKSKKEKSLRSKVIKIILIIVLVIALGIGIATVYLAGSLGGLGPLGFLKDQRIANLEGNAEEYHLENVDVLEGSPLAGMNLCFLGSSVTYGASSLEVSFVEYISTRNECTYVKEAVSGTTLADNGDTSYVQRMINNISADEEFDAFICQLSTNDASQGVDMGEISESVNLDDFDTTTVIGAMEYIICYAQETWECPVIFYTGTQYDSEQYEEMVNALYDLQEKWGIGIIDLWNGLDVNIDEYDLYMADSIHPTQAGYLEWWTPYMEEVLYEILG